MIHPQPTGNKPRRSVGGTAVRGIATALGVTLAAVLGAALGVVLRIFAAAVSAAKPLAERPSDVARVPEPLRPGWSRPRPLHLVKPTYWPMVLALGIAFALWGIVSSPIISVIGLLLFAFALANWIGELRHDP